MNFEKELINFLKQQIDLEKKIIESLNNALGDIKNIAVKSVLRGISLDSEKHAEVYASAIELLVGSPPLEEKEFEKQKEIVKRHIKMEKELIQRIKEILPSVKNRKLTFLLETILHDEERHHKLLKKILEILVKGETVTEKDWWNMLWKDALFHGALGG